MRDSKQSNRLWRNVTPITAHPRELRDADWRAHAEKWKNLCAGKEYKRSAGSFRLRWRIWRTYGESSRTSKKLPDKHREGKQTDNGKSTTRRRQGKGQARRPVLLMMVAGMTVEGIGAMARPREANTHCFQKGSFQTDQKMEREKDSLLIGERRAQVRSEFQEQDTSSLTRWIKNRLQKETQNTELVRRRSLDRLKNSRRARCVECSASYRLERANVPSVKHSRRQSGDA